MLKELKLNRNSTNRKHQLMVALLFLPVVSGCSKDVVVPLALTPPPVPIALMRDPGPSKCVLKRRPAYQPGEVKAYITCIEADRKAVHQRLTGLQHAVRTRESAASAAVLKAKKG